MRILVVGDLHGRLRQLHKAVEIIRPDAVFQVGDMGFFPDPASMDSPGRRHLDREPEEGEIFSYIGRARTFPCPLYFVRGNHEDFRLLDGFEGLGLPNLFYLRSGIHHVGALRIAAVGGEHFLGCNPNRRRLPKYTSEPEAEFILDGGSVDLVLSHDAPEEGRMVRRGLVGGSPYVSLAIESFMPRFLFHGHYKAGGDAYQVAGTIVYPMTVKPNIADEKGLMRISEALLGILDTDEGELKFSYLRSEKPFHAGTDNLLPSRDGE